MSDPFTIAEGIAAIGSWFANYTSGKISDAVLEKFKEDRVIDRAVKKTSRRLQPSEHRPSGGAVQPYLKTWIDSRGFDQLLRTFTHEGKLDEERVIERFKNATEYPEANRVSAQKVVSEFLQNLDEELNNADEGARLGQIISRQHAELKEEHQERKKENEAISEGVGEANDKIDQLLANRTDLSKPLKDSLREGLEHIHEVIAKNKLPEALELVDERLDRLSDFKSEHPKAEDIVEELRQHICLDAASIASWMSKSEVAERYWEKAKSIDVSFLSANPIPAARAAFNIGKIEDLRRIVEHLDSDHEERTKFLALLAFTDEDWAQAIELIPEDVKGLDLRLLRAQALIQELTEERVYEVHSHLQFAAKRVDSPLLKRLLAHAGFRLLQGILRHRFTLPDFDREKFIDQVREWTTDAVQAYESQDTSKSGYARTLMLANYVFDFLDEQETVSEFQNELNNLKEEIEDRISLDQDPDPDELKSLEDQGEMTPVDRLYYEAIHFENNGPRERAVTKLRLALELTDNREEQELIVDKLISLLASDNDLEAAEKILSQASELRSDLRQLLQARLVTERRGEGAALQFMEEAANEIPGSQLILSNLTRNLVQKGYRLQADAGAKDNRAQEFATKALDYAKELIQVFPSPESYRQLAEANWLNGDVPAAIKIIKQVRERGYFPLHLRRLLAQFYLDEDKVPTAIRVLEDAVEDYPDDWRLKNDTAALWGQYGDPNRAIELLEPVKVKEGKAPFPYINLALAYRQRGDQAQNDYEKAVEALELALESAPGDHQIIRLLYETSRLAGMQRKSDEYLQQMMVGASRVEADSVDDIDEAFHREGGGLLQFGDIEILAEYIRRDRETAQAADLLLENSLWSYGDRFQAQGRAWPNWFAWTENFEKQWQEGNASSPSIHAGWPTAVDVMEGEMMNPDDGRGILLDETSLLTLGVLKNGDSILHDLIDTGKELYLYPGALDRLQNELSDLEERRYLEGGQPYRALSNLLRDTDAIAPAEPEILDEVELPAEVKEKIGLEAFDVEVADREGGYYVTDIKDRAEVIPDIAISSRELLRTLYERGLVAASNAESVAEERPHTFGSWQKAEPVELSEGDTVVFGRFALLAWFESGLIEAAGGIDGKTGPTFKVGPWAGSEIQKEARKIEIITRATKKATGLWRTLLDFIDRGDLKELDSSTKAVPALDEDVRPIWSHTINILSAASEHDLHVWADDRFLSLVLKPFGLFIGDQKIQSEAQKLRDSFANVRILSTEQVLMYLAEQKYTDLSANPAAMGWKLVELGYRPLQFRLGLRHFLQEYPPYRRESPALPYQQLFQVLDAIHELPPEDAHPVRKKAFGRLLVSAVFPGLIHEAWRGVEDDNVDTEVRRTLASDLLGKFEESIRQESEEIHEFVGILWRSVQEELARTGDLTAEEKRLALRWLGEEAASPKRKEHRSNIVRALEDDLLEVISLVWQDADTWAEKAPTEFDADIDLPPGFPVQFAISRIIPLVETDLINDTDPLIRRVVGFVSELEGEGLVPFTVSDPDLKHEITVDEGELEESALDVFKSGLAGDPKFREMLYAGGLRFMITKQGSTAEGEEVDVPVDFDASLFQLLLRDEESVRPDLIDTLLQQLINTDPALAVHLLELKPRLLSEDGSERKGALKRAGLALLDSVFFQFQRDLSHGIKVLRKKSLDEIEAFTGKVNASPEIVQHFEKTQISGVWRDTEKGKRISYADMVRSILLLGIDSIGIENLIQQMRKVYDQAESDEVLSALKSSTELVWTSHNPLESAFSIVHALSTDVAAARSLNEEDQTRLQGWIGEELPRMITADPRFSEQDISDKELPYFDQRASHAAAGRLALYAIASHQHLEEANAKFEGDVELSISYLLRLTLRLQNQLLRVATGLTAVNGSDETAEKVRSLLETAEDDLGGKMPPSGEQDLFNPRLYGPGRLDLWIASVLRVLNLMWRHSPTDENGLPFWWSKKLEQALRNWSSIPENRSEKMIREARDSRLKSRLGIQVKHTPQELAGALLWKANKGKLPGAWHSDSQQNTIHFAS